MPTTKGMKLAQLEIPITSNISNEQLKLYLVLITEYMSTDSKQQQLILDTYPEFNEMFDIFETIICPDLSEKLRRKGVIKHAIKQTKSK